MSEAINTNSTNSTTTTTVPDTWENIPCVQYGFSEGDGQKREPKLRPIFEPLPDGATTASPVYILSRDQYERQERLANGYAVKGIRSIAKEIQNQCESDTSRNRILYPVHIESDEYEEEGPATLIRWLREFVEEWLEVPFHSCLLYFSGKRSIHVHVPRFVSGDQQLRHLKKLAEKFCVETGAELDCSIYSRKRLFRLPGVVHADTDLRKVEIEPDWEHEDIIRESATSTVSVPQSYEKVLWKVFVRPSLTKDGVRPSTYTPQALFRVLDSEKTILEIGPETREIETPLIEREECPSEPELTRKWTQYNAKEFSPYALAKGTGRSVAAVKVKGQPFARKEVRIGSGRRPVHALIPAYFYGARGCAGGEFVKDHEHAPLQLSKLDYEKWDYSEGDCVVIIGGKSNQSRIFEISSWQAIFLGYVLTGEDGSRQVALEYLQREGYDVGKSGSSSRSQSSNQPGTRSSSTSGISGSNETHAGMLQRRAEENGPDTLTHVELSNVANRLLQSGGWEHAWEWFELQFGDRFNPRNTWENLKGIVEYYDDIEVYVPPRP